MTGPLAGEDFKRLPGAGRKVALTFDCGGTAGGDRQVLETLEARGVPASFFMTGLFARRNPDLARVIAARYPLGNHSMTHPKFNTLTSAQRSAEVEAAAEALAEAAGRPADALFRFPYGICNKESIGEVNAAGYVSVGWTVDSAGWRGTSGGANTATVVDRVTKALEPGAIVLMHIGTTSASDPSKVDVTALPRLLDAITAQGYGYTTLLDFFRPAPGVRRPWTG
ncbi:polysaccharide deacetylase family protein [Streptomyces sp. NPDC048442]|uniref:polysaccharide deacetylase family protein n=1 Tax=Streptomyces sp. NPDC048442 TaxID=3154823 RepID=UPI00343C3FFE